VNCKRRVAIPQTEHTCAIYVDLIRGIVRYDEVLPEAGPCRLMEDYEKAFPVIALDVRSQTYYFRLRIPM
jgi:hypothetical protein